MTGDGFGPDCPIQVDRASMINRWDQLTFLHWSYAPEVIQELLPSGLTVDTFEGHGWVGLVPFMMEVRPPQGPALPWISRFCETNVRTYVVGPDGTRGVWFLSLDAARLPAVVVGRTTYRVPYFWSAMSSTRADGIVHYRTRRRWPAPRGVASSVRVRPGAPFTNGELGDLDHWLTAQWRLFSVTSRAIRAAWAEHPPWPLHHVDVLECDDELLTAAGLPTPTGEPLAHWSPGVEVRIGLPRRLS